MHSLRRLPNRSGRRVTGKEIEPVETTFRREEKGMQASVISRQQHTG